MSTFDPDALECLAAIIEEGGFERAAQRLSITQSAVSQRLRALEAQVGTVLIVRSRPLKPTPAGQLMLKHAKMMRLLRADLDAIRRRVAGFEIGYEPDFRQNIAASWPQSIDDTVAQRDWGWKLGYDLDAMVDDMLTSLKAASAAG